MRIHQHQDGSYSIDRHRYALNVLQRYDPEAKYKPRKTPAPPTYIYSKDNRPSTDEDKHQINMTYPDIDFCSAVCSLLYLAYNTRADILFIVCKLVKACSCPGMKDYEALVWLLGYLHDHPDLANMFCMDVHSSPVYKMCVA
jgi:hypothetical protein